MDKHGQGLSRKDQAAIAHHRLDLIYSLLRTTIIGCAVVGVVYLLPPVIEPLAGKNTLLALSVAVLGDIKFAVSIGLTGCATAWAVVERTLRHRKVEYLQGRIRDLETGIDPERTSSRLTTKGKTNPEDKP